MHGAWNDYVFMDGSGADLDWSRLAVAMSDRHRGVGSDGIILALPSSRVDLRMRMFNADGSEGKMCGNGIRCLVAFATKKGIVARDVSPVVVETAAGDRQVTPIWEDGRMTRATVTMGEPITRPADIPVDVRDVDLVMDYPIEVDGHSFNVSCVSMGNPHAVAFLDEPVDEVPLGSLGPLVEHHPMFPERVNFEVANVASPRRVKARVWERGSGQTMACGTGACAVAVVGRMKGLVEDEVELALPGGDLVVRWPGSGEVVLEGPVEEVFEGDWPD